MKKRMLSLLLALVMVIGLFPAQSLAAPPTSGECGKQGDNLTWRIEDSTLIIEGSGEMADYDYFDHLAPWDSYGEQITAIRLPDGMTTLDNAAFISIKAVKSLHIPKQLGGVKADTLVNMDGLESITVDPENPFHASLDGVLFNKDRTELLYYPEAKPGKVYQVPDGTQVVGRDSFQNIHALEQVTIPGSVKSIEWSTFCYCYALKKVVLSEGLEKIGGGCFQDCPALTEIHIPSSVKNLGEEFLEDTGFSKNPDSWEKGLLYLDHWLLDTEYSFTGHLTVEPGTVGLAGAAVKSIPGLTGVTIPNTVRYICNSAFSYNSGLTELQIPEGVEFLGGFSMGDCPALERVYLPKSLTSIGNNSFTADDALKEIHYAGNRQEWDAIEKPYRLVDETVVTIHCEGTGPMSGVCGSEGDGSNLKWILNEGVLTVSGTGYMDATPSWTSYGDAIKTAVLEDGVYSISFGAFKDCKNMETISLPKSLSYIEAEAFQGCTGLKEINYAGNRQEWDAITKSIKPFDETVIKINCTGKPTEPTIPPMPTLSGICGAEGDGSNLKWTMKDGCLTISGRGDMDTSSCSSIWLEHRATIQKIIVQEGATSISMFAFQGSYNLEEIYLPKTLTHIGARPLVGCTSLKDLYFAGSRMEWDHIRKDTTPINSAITTIHYGGSTLLHGVCGTEGHESSLKWALEDGTLTVSGTGAICDNPDWLPYRSEIKQAVLKSGVREIGNNAFSQCQYLESVSLPETLTKIGVYSFEDCRHLKEIYLPASLMEIDSFAFEDCSGLERFIVSPGNPRFYAADGVLFNADANALTVYPSGKQNPAYTIPRGIKAINYDAFSRYVPLRALGVPLSLQQGDPLFNPSQLTDIYYEGSRQQWEKICGNSSGNVTIHYNWKYGSISSAPKPFRSGNSDDQNYFTHGFVVTSYLSPDTNSTFSRVEAIQDQVILEKYSADKTLLEQRIITNCLDELPIFGGCFIGKERNFLVFGQDNPSEDINAEVIRVVSYTKDWKRLKDTRIFGANTQFPFDAGSLRMAEYGDYLYIRTCHQIFKTPDGLNHQTNMTLNIHTPTMELRDSEYEGLDIGGYVSHSFNQFIALDGDKIFTVDHGDGYPRAVVLIEHPYPAGQDTMVGSCKKTNLLSFVGDDGYNHTGASVGGFEISDRSYIVAGNTVDQKAGDPFANRNIFLSVLPKDTVGSGSPKLVMLTDYKESQGIRTYTPHLVKVDGNRLLVLWLTLISGKSTLNWQMVDGTGTPITPVYKDKDGSLSDCKPILTDGKVTWYVTCYSAPIFYSIDPAHPEKLTIQNTVKIADPSKTCTVTVDGAAHKVQGGSTLAGLLPAENPAKPGYDFKGWFSGEAQVNEGTIVYEDMTVVSRWTENKSLYTVTVDGTAYRNVKHNTRLSDLLPKLPNKAGHTLRWYDNGTEVEPRSLVRSDLELTHDWVFDVFTDVKEGQWFYNGVKYTTFRGLFSGVSPVAFGPEIKMDRAMVVQVLYSMAGKPDVTPTDQFTDVPKNEWYAKAVAWAVENGVASGYPGGRFGSTDVINREQLAVMLHGYAKKPTAQGKLDFADEADISGWAKPALQWAVENHIMSGVPGNKILPQGLAERSQGSVMIMQFHKLMEK